MTLKMGVRVSFRSSLLVLTLVGWCAASWSAEAAVPPKPIARALGMAFEQAEEQRYAEARRAAERSGDAHLAKFFRWLELTRSPEEGDFEALSRFLSDNPNWPQTDEVQRRAEEAMPDGLTHEQVLAWFDGRSPVSVTGAMHLAEALGAAGRNAAATALVRRTWREGSFTPEQESAFYARHAGALEPGDHIARLDGLLRLGRASAARRQAARLGTGYRRLAEARIKLFFDVPGVDAAIARVPAELQDDPGLLYERARWRFRRERHEGVVELLDRASAAPIERERWWGMRRWAARRAFDNGDPREAYRLASAHGLASGLGFAEGEWLSGWIALRFLGDPQRAYEHFTRLHAGVSTPISRARGAYWAGEAAAALQDEKSARHWYRRAAGHGTTFYGQLAGGRLGRPLDLQFDRAIEVSEAERRAFEGRELVTVARRLAPFDQHEHLATFLAHLGGQAQAPADFALVAELADSVGRTDYAVVTAKLARRTGLSLPAHLFPVPDDIRRRLAEYGSPEPALVFAVIRQESAFDPRAVSGAGARGLMQLMPATAHHVAHKINASASREALTANPEANLHLGRAYLGLLLERYTNNTILALAAYNAGPRRVDQWIKAHGDPRRAGVDPVDWIERIPFGETRNYVQRVLEGQAIYRLALSGQRTVLPLDRASAELGQLP